MRDDDDAQDEKATLWFDLSVLSVGRAGHAPSPSSSSTLPQRRAVILAGFSRFSEQIGAGIRQKLSGAGGGRESGIAAASLVTPLQHLLLQHADQTLWATPRFLDALVQQVYSSAPGIVWPT